MSPRDEHSFTQHAKAIFAIFSHEIVGQGAQAWDDAIHLAGWIVRKPRFVGEKRKVEVVDSVDVVLRMLFDVLHQSVDVGVVVLVGMRQADVHRVPGGRRANRSGHFLEFAFGHVGEVRCVRAGVDHDMPDNMVGVV